MAGGRGQGSGSVLHNGLSITLSRNESQHPECQSWEGHHCFGSAPIHVLIGSSKARDRKQAAYQRQLFCGRAKQDHYPGLLTSVMNPLGSTWGQAELADGEGAATGSSTGQF